MDADVIGGSGSRRLRSNGPRLVVSLGLLMAVAAAGASLRHPGVVTSGSHHHAAGALPVLQQESPASTTEQFEELLGHHAFVMARAMRTAVGDQPDASGALENALVRNTDDLSAAVGALYGPDYVAPFRQLWSTHVFLLIGYAEAAAAHNDAAQASAKDGLEQYRAQYGQAVETMTNGAIPAATAAENLRAHLDHLTSHIDAYVAGDYSTAFTIQRQAYEHMFPTAAALAAGPAPVPGELPTPVSDPSGSLRSQLAMLLGEHFELAVDATRSGVTGGADFSAIAEALNANTRDLTAAFDSLFGPDQAASFNQLWASHIDQLVAYTVATAKNDAAGREAARTGMADIAQSLATAFSELTGGAVSTDDALALLTVHDDQLMAQIDAFAAHDYDTAHQLSFDGYRHMIETAAALAPGIASAVSGVLPVGGVQTGGGGLWAGHG